MRYRLRNQRDTGQVLILTRAAWFGVLELGELYGWNPMSAFVPGRWDLLERPELGYDLWDSESGDGHYSVGTRLVVLEDALNLSDALEQAFLEHEPVATDRYTYQPLSRNGHATSGEAGIGVILDLIDFCRKGAFWVEASS